MEDVYRVTRKAAVVAHLRPMRGPSGISRLKPVAVNEVDDLLDQSRRGVVGGTGKSSEKTYAGEVPFGVPPADSMAGMIRMGRPTAASKSSSWDFGAVCIGADHAQRWESVAPHDDMTLAPAFSISVRAKSRLAGSSDHST